MWMEWGGGGRRRQMEAEEETKRTQMDCVEDRLAQQMRHEEQMDGLKRELGAAQEKAVGQFRSQLKRKEEELVGLGGVHAAGARPSPVACASALAPPATCAHRLFEV